MLRQSPNKGGQKGQIKTALIWRYNAVGQTKVCRFYRYTYLDFYNAGSLKQQSLGRWCRSIQKYPDSEPTTLVLSPYCCVLNGEAANTNFIVFDWSLFVQLLLAIVLSVLLRFMDSDYLPLVSSNSSYIWIFLQFLYLVFICKNLDQIYLALTMVYMWTIE
jgi:hypothetical protein